MVQIAILVWLQDLNIIAPWYVWTLVSINFGLSILTAILELLVKK